MSMVDGVNEPEYVAENRRYWNEHSHEWVEPGERNWSAVQPVWGQWAIPESDLGLLPLDMNGLDAIELGCGTGYVSAWMAQRGADVLAVDVSEAQLETAMRLRSEHELDIEFIHANAEHVPRPDASFDFAISEYGAALWADPHQWLREAARLLRPGGKLVFLSSHPFVQLCFPLDGSPAIERLERPYFGMHMFDWRQVAVDPGGVEFNLTIADWFDLLNSNGFAVERFLELQSPDDSEFTPFAVPARWAHRFPSEMVFVGRRV